MQLRESNIAKLAQGTTYDALIIGGGINGAVSAAALAGKGAKVALVDQGDFAGLTSMHSSNLAWGGIKYLESWDFSLVRELCVSRNHLIKAYPSTVQEIRFLTTLPKGFRWHPRLIWLGSWLYWVFGNGFTKTPKYIGAKHIKQYEPVINTRHARAAVEYSDAYLHDNDARFVFNFIRRAINSGAVIANYVTSTHAERKDNLWHVTLEDRISGKTFTSKARVLINACGPLADTYNKAIGIKTQHRHTLSKGIHLLVDKISQVKRVLAFFDEDGRLFFAIPMGNRTCIGTTDTPTDNPHAPINQDDIEFVLSNINARLDLARPLEGKDIIATRCGVRPLVVKANSGGKRDFLQLSRKHEIETHKDLGHVTIFGGKLTDCINVGDEISNLLANMGITLDYPDYRWYGEPTNAVRDEFFHQAKLMHLDARTDPEAPEPLSVRLWRRYASEAINILEHIRADPAQANILIHGTEYIRAEVKQAARREMITKLEDFLRRRSKIALVLDQASIKQSAGLLEACRILFGEDLAQKRFDEYFAEVE